ncbi:S1 RNA-binding domain-containing protein 1 [Protopterus annectens]|uniref:S1 RNA-binding domain-containing protein 1 n=1 Tax=Protopterus annectens TaxID=7888 RepID=UPI001CF9BE9E|nr:S1 RNA-binding domain-containing protein 1 [Protopterus annectens]
MSELFGESTFSKEVSSEGDTTFSHDQAFDTTVSDEWEPSISEESEDEVWEPKKVANRKTKVKASVAKVKVKKERTVRKTKKTVAKENPLTDMVGMEDSVCTEESTKDVKRAPKVKREVIKSAPKIKREKSSPKVAKPRKNTSGKKCNNAIKTETNIKAETESFMCSDLPCSSLQQPSLNFQQFGVAVIKEEMGSDFTCEPPLKKIKTSEYPDGKPVRPFVNRSKILGDAQMNWDITQLLSEKSSIEPWVCKNIINLFQDDNTIPFIVRYRKELINNLDGDTLRDVKQTLDELCNIAKKAHSVVQRLKKEGKLTGPLQSELLSCKTAEEVEHVSAPYKTGSKGTKAQRARQLGLEPAAKMLIENPGALFLQACIKPDVKGISTLIEVEAGVQHILADVFAKDREALDYVRKLCTFNRIMIESSLSKVATSKEGAEKDVEKFKLYHNFNCSIRNIQPHQILAINRGENLKILTVKINIPDRVKNEFCRWCVNVRFKPQGYARPELMKILRDAAEDAYKRLIYPLLCREYRSKFTSDAEKESVMTFGKNLRQLLLTNPVRGRTLLGVDPGYKHGCKLAIISPTSQILHTDVVYINACGSASGLRDAEKIRQLLLNYNCSTVVIGNGTACRETERYFADLIQKKFFAPLDVVYCITSEAGASIYSVSADAAKEMPDLDPNLRSAVSIARRVQDPLAELVKIEPKHIGVGMYQHDVSPTLLKSMLGSVVEECVSFVGVDINVCTETLLRHVAGLNATRAKNIFEWREKMGPFINREQLKEVKGLGPKSFQQCAGFIRINPENIKSFGSTNFATLKGTEDLDEKPPKKKSKATNIALKPNPLDQTCIHPESYNITMRFLKLIGGDLKEIGKPEMQQKVNAVLTGGMEPVAENLQTSVQTLQIIIDGLTQPEGYDIRKDFDKTDFKRNIVSLEDLRVGTILTGRVENAAGFGVFVDIGVGKDGLIPIRYITEDKLSKTKRRRSLGLGPGERVEVKVLEIDVPRLRVTLDLIRVL